MKIPSGAGTTHMPGERQQQTSQRVSISTAGGVSSSEILNVNIQADHKESIRDTEDIFKAEKTVKYPLYRKCSLCDQLGC